jgi:hypothetical protein
MPGNTVLYSVLTKISCQSLTSSCPGCPQPAVWPRPLVPYSSWPWAENMAVSLPSYQHLSIPGSKGHLFHNGSHTGWLWVSPIPGVHVCSTWCHMTTSESWCLTLCFGYSYWWQGEPWLLKNKSSVIIKTSYILGFFLATMNLIIKIWLLVLKETWTIRVFFFC